MFICISWSILQINCGVACSHIWLYVKMIFHLEFFRYYYFNIFNFVLSISCLQFEQSSLEISGFIMANLWYFYLLRCPCSMLPNLFIFQFDNIACSSVATQLMLSFEEFYLLPHKFAVLPIYSLVLILHYLLT